MVGNSLILKSALWVSFCAAATLLSAAPVPVRPHAGLLPQGVFLDKARGKEPRELYITLVNTSPRIFRNSENPITVRINGTPYRGRIFAKTDNERYHLWADIRSQEEGAIFVSFHDDLPYRTWQQCEKLEVVIDPEMKLTKPDLQRYYPGEDLSQAGRGLTAEHPHVHTLLLHDEDYSSDCRYTAGK